MAVIGIDLGGTKIIGALFDKTGNILCKSSHLLERRKGREVGLLLLQTIDELLSTWAEGIAGIEALGVCVPGIADSKTGLVWAPNIHGWEEYPLRKEIEEHINNENVRVDIASDRTCYILGETWRGATKGCRNAMFIAVGTGIGIGMLIDGKIIHGHGDAVGSGGWLALETPYFDEYERYGCLESYASGDGIARQTRKILKEGLLFTESVLYKQKIESITTKDVFEAYGRGDSLAKFVIGKAIIMWAMAAANLVSLLNPEKIVWGGGVFGPAAQLLERIYHEACRWAQPVAIRQVTFEKSQLSGEAGLYGAGYLAFMSLEDYV
jgi:glucokinase